MRILQNGEFQLPPAALAEPVLQDEPGDGLVAVSAL